MLEFERRKEQIQNNTNKNECWGGRGEEAERAELIPKLSYCS